jgi:hypothetical protein
VPSSARTGAARAATIGVAWPRPGRHREKEDLRAVRHASGGAEGVSARPGRARRLRFLLGRHAGRRAIPPAPGDVRALRCRPVDSRRLRRHLCRVRRPAHQGLVHCPSRRGRIAVRPRRQAVLRRRVRRLRWWPRPSPGLADHAVRGPRPARHGHARPGQHVARRRHARRRVSGRNRCLPRLHDHGDHRSRDLLLPPAHDRRRPRSRRLGPTRSWTRSASRSAVSARVAA